MTVIAFRVQQFMGFADSGWIELQPITLLFGRNSSGKSALIRALLLLRQSLDSGSSSEALLFARDDGYDFGDYTELVRDHDVANDFSFWFKMRFQRDDNAFGEDIYVQEALRAIDKLVGLSSSDTQTITVRLVIGLNDQKSTELKGVHVLNQDGDIIFRASKVREKDFQHWLIETSLFELNDPEFSPPELWNNMEIFSRRGFLPWMRPKENVDRRLEEDFTDSQDITSFGKGFQYVWLILRGVRRSLSSFFEQIDYIGPLRSFPQRFYYVAGQRAASPERGRNFVRNLVQADATKLATINDWMQHVGIAYRLYLQPLDERHRLYELRLQDTTKDQSFSANIREVGFGITQLLPIITQVMLAIPGDLVIIEQPELHLHPRAQAELTDLFIAMARQGMRFLIETHSEHVLLRLRRRIAETTAGIIPAGSLTAMSADQLRAYFVDRQADGSTVELIDIDQQGKMSSPPGFRGFFADDLYELAELNRAILSMSHGGSGQ